MASCITPQWVNTAPQFKLTVTQSSSTTTTVTYTYTLEYIASSAANTNGNERWTRIFIDRVEVRAAGININGKTGTHTVGTWTITKNKSTSARNLEFSIQSNITLTWSGVYKSSVTAAGYITIPALPTYKISYDAAGGTGAPSSQTKTAGTSIKLSTTNPTRTGYTFQGWTTQGGSTTVDYAAGATYTTDAAMTLYAVWKINTYTVSYNANKGTGAPSSQTKTHGSTLKLSTTKPSRTGYNFLGWATSASGTVIYESGANYTNNAAITLYAVWEYAYVKPIIFSLIVSRCDASGLASDTGTYALVKFNWETMFANPTITIGWSSPTGGTGSHEISATGNSGSLTDTVVGNGELSTDSSYTMTVRVADSDGDGTSGYSVSNVTLPGVKFAVDVLADGKGISFGKPAELANTVDFGWDAKFNNPVYGKALGMDRLPEIPANSDFNNYMTTGCYAVYSNANAATISNIPVTRAGRLEVWSSTGEGVRVQQWSYLRQRYIPYNSSNAVWERELARGEDNKWIDYGWWRSSLTPVMSERLYSRAAITISPSSNVVLGVLNTYTQIPLNNTVLSTSSRLTIDANSVKIGSDIQFVKVSGQTLLKCGPITGNRHVRIHKVSATGTITGVSWTCIYAEGGSNTLYSLAPVVVSVTEGDSLQMVFYTSDTADQNSCGSSVNGWQTYLTVEEL